MHDIERTNNPFYAILYELFNHVSVLYSCSPSLIVQATSSLTHTGVEIELWI